MNFQSGASVFPSAPAIGFDFGYNEMFASCPSGESPATNTFLEFPISLEVPPVGTYVEPGNQWFDGNPQSNANHTTNPYHDMTCAPTGTSLNYITPHITSGWTPSSTEMPFTTPFPPLSSSDFNTFPSHTSWHPDMSHTSTPSLYHGSSSSSSPISCPSPAPEYGHTDLVHMSAANFQGPLMGQQPTIVEPAPVSHQDSQQLFDFLSTMQDIAPPTASVPALKSNAKSKRVYKPRPVKPRVTCPDCGRGFCRTDALNRHLKNTCGMQCSRCVGKIMPGVACPHHRGTGRPLRAEKPLFFASY